MQYRRSVIASLLADSIREFLSGVEAEEQLSQRARRRIAAMRVALELWEGKSRVGEVRPISGFRKKVDAE